MVDRKQIEQAIYTLEAQRNTLGDAVVDPAIAGLRKQLEALEDVPDQQRKLVTLLYMDVAGSTRLVEGLDPEDITTIMDGALKQLSGVIEQHGGYVTRFMGDGFIAVFGNPIAKEDDAERAVQAGLALQEDAKNYAAKIEAGWGRKGFNIRVGVNTGLVAIGGFSEADDTIMGLTVNLAARLESAAPVGGVLISHNTYQHIRGLFDIQPLEPISAKGFSEPVKVYAVLRARPRVFHRRVRGVEGVETHMVGREAELHWLEDAYHEAVKERMTQVITVIGDAGLGKSRLLYEFENWIDLQIQEISIFKGRADPQTQGAPYSLARDLFAIHFQILDSDPAAVAREKLEAGVIEIMGQEGLEMSHVIGQLLGFDFTNSPYIAGIRDDAKQIRDRAFHYCAQFLAAVTQRSPAAILLEDLHWADDGSLDLADYLIHNCRMLPLIMINLTRPSLFERRPVWSEDSEGVTRLALQPLSREDCRKLLEEILGKESGIPTDIQEEIINKSDGNPFYIEELVKMMIEHGVLEKDDGHWKAVPGRLERINLPLTLTALLQSRLDSLPAPEKMTLQQASVIGRHFWTDSLQVLQETKTPPTEVLADLSTRELIFKSNYSVFEGTTEYLFKHALLRDVTYETVLKRIRKIYHARVAEWLVKATRRSARTEEYTPVIAEHYAMAGNWSEAADWYVQAGEHAHAQGAPFQARQFFDRALDLLPPSDRERRWRVYLGRNEVLGMLGETEARIADDAALIALANEMEDDDRLAEAYYRSGSSAQVTGDNHTAIASFQSALAAAQRAGNLRLEVLVLGLMAISHTRLDEMDAAGASAEKALNQAQALGDEITLARVLTNISVFYTESGDIAKGAHLLERQIEIIHRLGNRMGEAVGLTNLGYSYVLLGLYDLGASASEKAQNLCEAIGARRESAYSRLNLGLAYLGTGNAHAARQVLAHSLQELHAIGDGFGEAASQTYLALILEQLQEVERAATCFREAQKIMSGMGVSGYAHDALAGMARCLLKQGNLEQAKEYGLTVWEYLTHHGAVGMEFPARAYQTCAEVFEAMGNAEKARDITEAGYHELMQRAEKISDTAWRKSFLENVPEHYRLVQTYQKMSGPWELP